MEEKIGREGGITEEEEWRWEGGEGGEGGGGEGREGEEGGEESYPAAG